MRWWNEKAMLWLQHRPTHVWFPKTTGQITEQGPLSRVSVRIPIYNLNQTPHKTSTASWKILQKYLLALDCLY